MHPNGKDVDGIQTRTFAWKMDALVDSSTSSWKDQEQLQEDAAASGRGCAVPPLLGFGASVELITWLGRNVVSCWHQPARYGKLSGSDDSQSLQEEVWILSHSFVVVVTLHYYGSPMSSSEKVTSYNTTKARVALSHSQYGLDAPGSTLAST
jgi:hypothetical protein